MPTRWAQPVVRRVSLLLQTATLRLAHRLMQGFGASCAKHLTLVPHPDQLLYRGTGLVVALAVHQAEGTRHDSKELFDKVWALFATASHGEQEGGRLSPYTHGTLLLDSKR